MSVTSAELVKARLEHLWQLSLASIHVDEKCSRNFNKLIFRLAQDNEIVLGGSFFQMVCQHCFQFFVPGVSCTLRYFESRKVRRLSKVIRASQLNPDSSYRASTKALVPVVKCLFCKFCTAFDTSPVAVQEYQHRVNTKAVPTTPSLPAKKEALQKVIYNSAKSASTKKESLDLESFLQGFL